ncbi:MAG: SPW repeat protein [Planctomycetaceae bacterium]|nr:SPW repeat protein [Planctomycetaceae bacterium]
MWSRVVEIMFGCWLLISPFVFGHESGETTLWVNDLACGSAVIAFGLSSYWRPTRHAHLLTIGVSLWLIVFAYWHGFTSAPPESQNHTIIGLTLLMFAVIPNGASRPAAGWEATLETSGS